MSESPGANQGDPAATSNTPSPAEGAAPERQGFGAWVRKALAAFADWFWSNVTVGGFGVWLVGQIWRDGSKVTALCFLVPSFAVAGGLLLTALLARLCTCRRIAWAALILSLPPLVSTLAIENRWLAPRPKGDPKRRLRLVHWNAGGTSNGLEPEIAKLKSYKADAYILSEVYGPEAEGPQKIAEALGSDFTYVRQHHLTLIARGRTRLVLRDERISRRAYFVEWESGAGLLTILLLDAPSSYYHTRLLHDIRDRIAAQRPDVAAGDLNAPRRSRALNPLPKGYTHAYDAAGAGWSATWHDRYPIWAIDQCVIGPRIQPIRYRIEPTGLSDHRLGVLDFSVAKPPEQAGPDP